MIPGHGIPSADVREAVAATRDYIHYVRDAMRRAVADFIPFDEAYAATDWSAYQDLPAFEASNRGNAYRIWKPRRLNSTRRLWMTSRDSCPIPRRGGV